MSIATEIRLRIKAEGEAVLQGLGDKLNKIAANATASSQKFSILAGELRKVEATTGRSTTLLKQYSASWRELAGAVDIASKEFKEATAESARLDAQIAKAEGRNRKAGSRLKTGAQVAGTAVAAGIFGGPEAAIGAVAGGIAGGVPGAQVGAAVGATVSQLRQALGATAAYEAEIKKLEIALKGVTTSQIEYNDALKFIKTSTDNYAVTQDILTRQFTKLQASVQGSGGTLQDTKIVFDGIVSAVRATGGSLQDVDSALTATAQVFSKGKVSAEELRQQIGERLPGAFTLFAKSMDMTPQQLDKALEGGKVSLKDFMVFAKDLFDRYGENAKVIADSPAAAGDRLKIALSNLNKSVGQLLQPIGAAFQDTFGSIAREITRAANALNNFFGIGGEALVNKNTTDINAINIRIRAKERQLKALESKDPSFVGPTPGKKELSLTERATSGAFADDRKRIQAAIDLQKSERERLRKEINDATRNSIVTPTDEGKGLPGIDLDAGKDKKGGRGATAAANALAASKERTEVLKQEANTLFDMALMQDKIYDLGQKGGKQAILDLTFEKDRLKILGEYDVKATKVDNTANKSAELKALQNKRNVELVALQLKFEEQTREVIREQNQLRTTAKQQIEDVLIASGAIPKEEAAKIQLDRTVANFKEQFKTLVDVDALSEQLRKALEQAAIDAKDFGKQFGKAFQDGIKSMGDLAGNLGSSFASAFEGMADQLTEFVTTGKMKFRDFAASVLKDISRMIIRYALFQAMQGIFSSIGGFFNQGNLGSSAANLAQYAPLNAKGNVYAQNGIQAFARGGIVNKPTVFPFANGIGLMGEAGPEAIMPLRRGRDGNLGVMSSGGGTTNVVVNVDASGSSVEGDQSQAKALGNAISAAVQSELVKQKRPGGLLA
jgi:lambda family phage tail tape measure protein